MGVIQKREGKKGVRYRVLIRKVNEPVVSKTFLKKDIAKKWMRQTEEAIEQGSWREDIATYKAVTEKYIVEMSKIKSLSKKHVKLLWNLSEQFGDYQLKDLSSSTLQNCAFEMRENGMAPSTIMNYLTTVGTVLRTSEAMWGYKPKMTDHRRAMDNLQRMGVVAQSEMRDRRVSDEEITHIIEQHATFRASPLPLADWIYFAVATTMRAGEIARLRWSDLSQDRKSIIIRQRKHPKKKRDEKVPLVPAALKIIEKQTRKEGNDLIFWAKQNSIAHAFRRARDKAGLYDIRFHDLRHEGISRLFEAGLDSMVVRVFSGHRDVNMLARYTHMSADKILELI